jgi:hypothetical protein
MVAYSFKRQFVRPILDGTKRQTIRADRRRHARPGEELQLYTGMRTKECRLICRARCLDVLPIFIAFRKRARTDWVRVGGKKLDRPSELDAFARHDGFKDWGELREFWRTNHPGVCDFRGVMITWDYEVAE